MCAQLFFQKKCVQPLKKSCARLFFWSLERVWRFPKLIFPIFLEKINVFLKNDIKQRFFVSLERVWSEFGESLENLQTHSKLTKNLCLMSFFKKMGCCSKKKKENMSLENLQTLQTHKKYACTTFFQKKICVQPLKKSCARIFFWSLERVWRFSKLIFSSFILE